MLLFWTFAFPIILGTFFNMAFSDIENNEKLDIIDIAIIDNEEFENNQMFKEAFETLGDESNDDRIFNIKYTDIEEAKNADQLVILNSGKIVAQGKPKDILSNETNLRKYELDIPFALKVALGLQKNGIKTSKTLDMEVLIKELCQLHLKK